MLQKEVIVGVISPADRGRGRGTCRTDYWDVGAGRSFGDGSGCFVPKSRPRPKHEKIAQSRPDSLIPVFFATL
jgi:hypothetical protein